MGASFRGEDAPIHVGETVPEKRCGGFDDEMVRLEPRGVAFPSIVIRIDQFEADEGVHLVDFAADVFRHRGDFRDVGIGGDFEKPPLTAEGDPPQDAVEKRPLRWIVVAGSGFREIEK